MWAQALPSRLCVNFISSQKLPLFLWLERKPPPPLASFQVSTVVLQLSGAGVHCSVNERNLKHFSSVQSLSHVWLFANPWTAAHQASLSIINSWSLFKPMSIESVMPSNHLILCCPFSSCPQSIPASGSFSMSQLFASGHQSIGVSASASVLPMNTQDWSPLGWTGWISLQSLLQHHSSKASVLRHSAFFTVQLSHPYMTTGKTIALTRWTFVGKVMSLLLNMLFRLVTT